MDMSASQLHRYERALMTNEIASKLKRELKFLFLLMASLDKVKSGSTPQGEQYSLHAT